MLRKGSNTTSDGANILSGVWQGLLLGIEIKTHVSQWDWIVCLEY
jgi:hypothetical protein